jgi:hypothetical protein
MVRHISAIDKMTQEDTASRFSARVLRPQAPADGDSWAFVVLPQEASAKLPRRGRTSIEGTLDGCAFKALLEPDGQQSHWLRLDAALLKASGAKFGGLAQFEIAAMAQEPEPAIPADLLKALQACPKARATWDASTTLARLDWIHWLTSTKQTKTRAKRVSDACDMLAAGKKRVCCFDPSGYYSKAFSAPQSADQHLDLEVEEQDEIDGFAPRTRRKPQASP